MNGWLEVGMVKPRCPRDPDALGEPVLIWPRNPQGREHSGVDGHAYYGRRATGKPAFYKHGAEIHGVTHWMPMPKGPNAEVSGAGTASAGLPGWQAKRNYGVTMFEEVTIGECRLILGDCREVLPLLPTVDAVITDPPYGIGFDYNSHDDSLDGWFLLMDEVVPQLKALGRFVIMPSCQVKRLGWWYEKHSPEWVVCWHKGSPGHVSTIGFNDWEPHVCWGRPKRPMHDYFSTQCGFDDNGHPCPKPERYSTWLVDRGAAHGETVCDPFMGSGTTGVACVKLGRKFIGIEKDSKYFDIACRRIEQAYAQPRLFEDAKVGAGETAVQGDMLLPANYK